MNRFNNDYYKCKGKKDKIKKILHVTGLLQWSCIAHTAVTSNYNYINN